MTTDTRLTILPRMQDSRLRTPSGHPIPVRVVAGTALVLVVAAVCIRLGFWQLSRRAEVAERNAAIAARLDEPPVVLRPGAVDTAGILYRVSSATGRFDHDRSIVLPGRGHLGAPGVHLLTPLVLADGESAILVKRGWLPAPDAARADLDAVRVAGDTAVSGLLTPFPGSSSSLAPGADTSSGGSFRRVWYAIDEGALRAQFPYRLEDAMLQLLPTDEAALPVRLPPPPLDPGPHLGYASQWFSFAVIAVVGWLALLLRGGRQGGPGGPTPGGPGPGTLAVALLAGACLVPTGAGAQLRPVDPLDWSVFEVGTPAVARMGVTRLDGQIASLAGTRGRLLEVGNFLLNWRSGRMAVELAGTAWRRYRDEVYRQEPWPGVLPGDGQLRADVGAIRAGTAIQLTSEDAPLRAVLRFGTILPTTSNEPGLDRDRTDFFATVAGRWERGGLALFTEHGVGVNGTRVTDYEQNDVWMYAAGAELDLPAGFRADALLVGHDDLHEWTIRGNEDLRELRMGLRVGEERWLRAGWVKGLTDFSPERGLLLEVGLLLRDAGG